MMRRVAALALGIGLRLGESIQMFPEPAAAAPEALGGRDESVLQPDQGDAGAPDALGGWLLLDPIGPTLEDYAASISEYEASHPSPPHDDEGAPGAFGGLSEDASSQPSTQDDVGAPGAVGGLSEDEHFQPFPPYDAGAPAAVGGAGESTLSLPWDDADLLQDTPGGGSEEIPQIQQDDAAEGLGADLGPCDPYITTTKDLDLVIFGATGFIGRLATEYLAHNAKGRRRWAIASNDPSKLNALFWQFRENPAQAPSEVIVADATNVTQMIRLAQRTKVILSFAGPYAANEGEEVIRAALNGCAHYVDVSVETHWMGLIVHKYHKVAESRGLALVQSSGWYSMAADFLAMSSAQALLRYTGQDPAKVTIAWNVMNFEPPGTHALSNQMEVSKFGQTRNPYVLLPEVPLSQRMDQRVDGFSDKVGDGQIFGMDKQINMLLEPFAPAKWSCNVVRRSMYMNFSRQVVSVREAKTAQSDAEFARYMLYRRYHHTSPMSGLRGYGPDEALRVAGKGAGTAFAYQDMQGPPQVGTSIEAEGDPLSVATPRMAIEMAVILIEKGPFQGRGGYLTPATAVEIQELERRLTSIDEGARFKIRHFTSTDVGRDDAGYIPIPS